MDAIYLNKKYYYLGLFRDEADAAKAYDQKAFELLGENAKLNFSAFAGGSHGKAVLADGG